MSNKTRAGGILSRAIALTLAAAAASSAAQAAEKQEVAEVVVVTGSYIRGTPEDAALPVDVVSADDLEAQGSPSVVQFVKTITAAQSSIGESNRYNGGAGTASINLRGFGAARTLSLMNGRRLADSPLAAFQGGGANLNFIPQGAVGRVEILKDGAAATYGSDAIGGVVNFITRTDLDGFEIDGEYSVIDGSDGDYHADLAWGSRFERGNVLLVGSYRHRSRLDIRERDWALAPFDDPNYGGWTGASNPGTYILPGTAGTFRDNGCAELGGQLTNNTNGQPVGTNSALLPSSTCRFQFSNFNDLVNDEDHFQGYGEINFDLTDTMKMHAELAWAEDDVNDQRLSPANLTAQYPSPISAGGTSGSFAAPFGVNSSVRYNVPTYHPGLIDLRTQCAAPLTPAQCTAMATASGVDISPLGFRAIAHAGHPTNKDGADHQDINNEGFRASVGLNGEWGELNWDTAVTYARAEATTNTNDLIVSNLQLALNGFGSLAGGTPCTAARVQANAGTGNCYFFNPFTNSLAVSAVNGQQNPFYRGGTNAAVVNDPRLVKWLYGNYENEFLNEVTTFDAVVSGDSGIALGGGNIGWAAGAQVRHLAAESTYGRLFNTAQTPCVDSVDDGAPGCANPAGPFIFFGSDTNFDDTRDVYAVFTEVRAPITDRFDASLAVRFEDYGGGVGNTTDPKLSLRWQALDWVAFRGSASTTFRAPILQTLDPQCATGVVQVGGQYRAQETCGNADLKPETADTFNLGVLFNVGNFTASVDYFRFDFEGELTLESSSRMFATMFPTGVAASTATGLNAAHPCNIAAFDALRARFSFAGTGCSGANPGGNVVRISRNNLNGPSTRTSGFDVRLQYEWPELLAGSVTAGIEGTYLEEYQRGRFTLLDDPSVTISAPEDRSGKHDLITEFFSYPRLRGNAFVSYSRGPIMVRWQTRYAEGTEAAANTSTNEWVSDGAGGFVPHAIGKLDDFIQHDLVVRTQLPWDTTLTASVQNLFDEDPPDAPSQYNYDYTNGNPLGRVFEIGVKKRF